MFIKKVLQEIQPDAVKKLMQEYTTLLKTQKETSKNLNDVLLLTAITQLLEKESHEQATHLENTAKLAALFGRKLKLPFQQQQDLFLLAKYHDIGKVNISKQILNKPEKLNETEWLLIKQHPVFSYNILKHYPNLKNVAVASLHHHERFDGTGYPKGLKAQEIPYLSRVIAILDTYEVLTTGRIYKKPISVKDALEEINRCEGTQFDPEIAQAFTKFILSLEKQKNINNEI